MLYKFYFEKLVETEELLNRHTIVDTLPNIKKYSSSHLSLEARLLGSVEDELYGIYLETNHSFFNIDRFVNFSLKLP